MHKFKLLASGIALAGISVTASATPEVYLGAQMGYQSTDMEYTESGKYSDNFGSAAYSATTDYSLDGVAGGIFAGTKFYVADGFYIAPEVNLGNSTADGGYRSSNSSNFGNNSNSSNFAIEAEPGKSYGFGVLLGNDLTANTSVYGRLGYQRTDYELTASGTGFDTESEDDTFGGIRYGIGLETAMTDTLALRLDWSLTDYSDESYSETTQNEFGGTETNTVTFDPTENLFQVGLSYTF